MWHPLENGVGIGCIVVEMLRDRQPLSWIADNVRCRAGCLWTVALRALSIAFSFDFAIQAAANRSGPKETKTEIVV